MSGTPLERHHVLMLVSGFPPARQAILRVVKFAKYLPEDGWAPLILTPGGKTIGLAEQLLAIPPDVCVKRTPRLPTLSMLAMSLGHWTSLRRVGSMGSMGSSGRSGENGGPSQIGIAIRTVLVWSDTPDGFAGWIPFAVATGWKLARSYQATVIYASGPPFSVVVAGAVMSRLTGLPLVADFRDAWTLDPSNPFGTLTGPYETGVTERRVRLLRTLERWVLARSHAVVFTSNATRSLYTHEYREIEDKSDVIYNGADAEDFVGEVTSLERPTVAHVGTLHDYQWDQVRVFLSGFAQALRARVVPADTQVVFSGAMGIRMRARVEAALSELGIASSARLVEFMPHSRAVELMRGSSLLLAFVGENPYVRLSKISEYIAARRPMLAFAARKSETAEAVQLYGGRILSTASEREVETELALAFSDHADHHRESHSIGHPHPLNRRTEAQELAKIFRRVMIS